MAVKFVTMKDVKERTPWVLKEAQRGKKVFLTLRGQVKAMIKPVTEEDFEATLLSESAEVKALIARAEREWKMGKTVDLEEVFADLGRKH